MNFTKLHKVLLKIIILTLTIVGFLLYYIGYGWTANPWADERVVWDGLISDVAGKTFSITGRAAYNIQTELLPLPVKNLGYVSGSVIANPLNSTDCISLQPANSNMVGCDITKTRQPELIKPSELFTIQKTYWVRHNFLSGAFSSDYRVAIISKKNRDYFIFHFRNFDITNKPELKYLEDSNKKNHNWNYSRTEIAYD